jgi:hypothetical protein
LRHLESGRFFGPRLWCDVIVADEDGKSDQEAY